MTDYVTISNAAVQPKSPVTSELITALRDNPTSIAEGNVDAPKISGRAAADKNTLTPITVAAANTYTLGTRHNDITVGTTSTSSTAFVVAHTVEIVAVTGTVRFSAEQQVNYGSGGSSSIEGELRVLKNASIVTTWALTEGSSPGAATANRSSDIAVVPGDIITWEHRISVDDAATTNSVQINSPTEKADDQYAEVSLLKPESEL